MSTLTSYASEAARDSAAPAASNTGLCIFRTDTKAIEVSDGSVYLSYNNDGAVGDIPNLYQLSLDGTDDHAEVTGSSEIQISNPLTISAWIYLTANSSTNNLRTIISWGSAASGQGRFFGVNNTSNNLEFGSYQSSTTSSTSLSLNTWYHVAATVTTGATKLYINGSLDTTGSNTLNSFTYGKTHVGELYYSQTTAARHFAGKIDELALFNSVLGATEIAEIYNDRVPLNLNLDYENYSSSANLKAWWRMGDGTETGSGATIYDMSSNDSSSDDLTIIQGSIDSTNPVS
jgi:hypothetical protein